MKIRCKFLDISYLSETQKNNFQFLNHNDKTRIQYTVIFHGCKTDYFQMKICDIFLIFAQNIDRGYTLELPH